MANIIRLLEHTVRTDLENILEDVDRLKDCTTDEDMLVIFETIAQEIRFLDTKYMTMVTSLRVAIEKDAPEE